MLHVTMVMHEKEITFSISPMSKGLLKVCLNRVYSLGYPLKGMGSGSGVWSTKMGIARHAELSILCLVLHAILCGICHSTALTSHIPGGFGKPDCQSGDGTVCMSNKFPGVASAAGGEERGGTLGEPPLLSVAVREASGLTNCVLSKSTF